MSVKRGGLTAAQRQLHSVEMSDTGVYLYGFAKPDPVGDFTHSGFEEIGPARPLMIEGLAAIVSIVPLGVIESGLACEPVDPAWIVPRALHHESVIAAVKARAAVLPVRFGCVFASQQTLADVAGRHRETIERFLLEIMDQEEWSLKAYLDVDQAIEALLQVDPTLSERFRSLPAAPGRVISWRNAYAKTLAGWLYGPAKRRQLGSIRRSWRRVSSFIACQSAAVKRRNALWF